MTILKLVKFYLLYKRGFGNEDHKVFVYVCKVMPITAAPIRTTFGAAVATRFLADELRVDSGNEHSGTKAINLTPESPTALYCKLIPPLAQPATVNLNKHPLQRSF